MRLFRKKNAETKSCSSGDNYNAGTTAQTAAGIKVLGSGCSKCRALEEAAREALSELGMNNAIDHVTDFAQIAAYGVMTTPALVVDGKVVSYGKSLNKDEAKALIQQVRN